MYMSEEEKKMNREEWLTYYDEVVANEKQALDNAPMSNDNFCHSLRLEGYYETDFGGMAFMLEKTVAVPVEFEDANGNRLPVKSYTIVHQSGRRFVRMEGGMGQQANLLFAGINDDTKIVLELHNGDMAVVEQASLKQLSPSIDGVQVVKAQVFDASNGHVAMIHQQITR
jgi:hypothetical protein